MAQQQVAQRPQTQHKEHHEHPVTPIRDYLLVYFFLLVLMTATIYAAQLHLGSLNNVVAMAIAVTKAVLVILIFMGVRYNTRLTWLWVGAGFVWLMLLFATVGDFITRDWGKVTGWQ